MADFEAPSGPPPPKVPEGWVARWNDQYKEWFYVNTYTKKSQWDKPTEPARPPHDDGNAPAGPPPSYTAGDKPVAASDAKVNPYDQPQYGGAGGASSSSNTEEEDAKLARQLQAEEDARARGSSHTPGIGGAAASYGAHQPQHSSSSSPFPGSLPVRPDQLEKGKSFLGKLFGGKKGPSGSHGGSGFPGGLGGLMGNSHGGQHQQHGYGHGPAPPPMGGYASHSPQPGYGGYPPQHGYGGYPPQQGYGGHPPPMGGGYYGQPGYGHHNGRPAKSGPSAGMMAGGAALGVGAGLVGGMMVADAINDNEQEMYQEGYQDGAGGEDFGGDDFGGDF